MPLTLRNEKIIYIDGAKKEVTPKWLPPAGGGARRRDGYGRIGQGDAFDAQREARRVRNDLVHRVSQPDLRPRATRGGSSCCESSDRSSTSPRLGGTARPLGEAIDERDAASELIDLDPIWLDWSPRARPSRAEPALTYPRRPRTVPPRRGGAAIRALAA
ncbi:hypothetical protein T492DRAFT_240464 [Pavlovales sp. CCMP2436]|nr:hypothetical protein T492DRAFT_240464 [Pavlovales sp. CCMP2436]